LGKKTYRTRDARLEPCCRTLSPAAATVVAAAIDAAAVAVAAAVVPLSYPRRTRVVVDIVARKK